MATSRPFTYNPSPNPNINGTEQVGDLSVGIPISGFTTSPQFWNGPDEELGYVIAHPTPSGFQPNPVFIPAYLGFWRTPDLTDGSFISLAEYVSVQNSTPQTFSSATQASTWLTTNGYWNSYATSFTITSSRVTSPSSFGGDFPYANTSGYQLMVIIVPFLSVVTSTVNRELPMAKFLLVVLNLKLLAPMTNLKHIAQL